MSQFNAGDEVRIIRKTSGYAGKLRVGDTAIISEFNRGNCSARMSTEAGLCSCFHDLRNIELVKHKWSIYNNDLPWEKLSNKQKGKLMVAENDGYEIKGVKCTALNKPVRFDCHYITYFAVQPEPVKPEPPKPEPTMAALFVVDWNDCMGDFGDSAIQMIAKGWNKPCK